MLWGDVLQHAYIIQRTPNNSKDAGSGMSIPTARNVAQAGSESSRDSMRMAIVASHLLVLLRDWVPVLMSCPVTARDGSK
ncbi:hypothetical protein TNCV_2200181 [Trichonephila clavipes]|nr:hypothetical protein TNCV_2200181 [Trichonephila clavipes]